MQYIILNNIKFVAYLLSIFLIFITKIKKITNTLYSYIILYYIILYYIILYYIIQFHLLSLISYIFYNPKFVNHYFENNNQAFHAIN